jgi:hypothetical protein
MSEAGLADAKARIQLFAAALKGHVGVITLILKDDQDGQTSFNGLEGFMHLQAMCVQALPRSFWQRDLSLLKSY